MMQNKPELWRDLLPHKSKEAHKYDHGYALIYGAPELTGATVLAASACARMGTGLVTILSDGKGDVFRTIAPPHILVRDDIQWSSDKVTAKLYGPGGLCVTPDFDSDILTILDADALLNLPDRLKPNFILTPHEGEFQKAFPELAGNKIEKAQEAAKQKNCYIVLKGSETIIATPDGKYAVNMADAPWLATAGTGDVLAGMITGLIARHMPVFEACCAAVWIHGECGKDFGQGLVATDLIDLIPKILEKKKVYL